MIVNQRMNELLIEEIDELLTKIHDGKQKLMCHRSFVVERQLLCSFDRAVLNELNGTIKWNNYFLI